MRKYEIIFIVKPMEEEATNAVVEKFTKLVAANGGTVDKARDALPMRSRTALKVTMFCSMLLLSQHV